MPEMGQFSKVERCIILTGMSGGGKSTALHMLEDQGFFAIDNIPPRLLTDLLNILAQHRSASSCGVAAVIDVRGEPFLSDLERVVYALRKLGVLVTVVFLDATDELLLRRFEATRRKHPLSDSKSLLEGITRERQMMEGAKELADIVVDTTNLKVRELRSDLLARLGLSGQSFSLVITSFGFKYGPPQDVDFLFDVRALPNPYYVVDLQNHSGLDQDVIDYLMSFDITKGLIDKIANLILFVVPEYKKMGKNQVHIAIGCTGGRHRSVAIAELIKKRLEQIQVATRHRDLKKDLETEGTS